MSGRKRKSGGRSGKKSKGRNVQQMESQIEDLCDEGEIDIVVIPTNNHLTDEEDVDEESTTGNNTFFIITMTNK